MTLNHLLIWIICFWCAALLVQASRLPLSYTRGWLIVSGFILATTTGMLFLLPEVAGLIGGIFWLIFVLIPMLVFRLLNRLSVQQRYAQASKLASFLRWLHPADGWLELPQLFKALDLGNRGEMAEAMQILSRYQTFNTRIGRMATIFLYRMTARWEELLDWIGDNFPEKVLLKDADLASFYLRCLGETGDLNGLLQTWERFEGRLEKTGDAIALNMTRMYILAFCGQSEQVQRLFDRSLAMYPQNVRLFWLATAEMAAGNQTLAREQFLALRDRSDVSLRHAIAWRLSQVTLDPNRLLADSSKQILSRLITDLKQESRYSKAVSFGKKPYATYALIGLNLLVFAVEVRTGGSQNLDNLYRLGALVPETVWAGEWWRLLSATFLHFGFLHLLMNMLGLYYLGVFVEFKLGIWKYLIAYFFSGVGSMLAIASVAAVLKAPIQIVVGASGAIMGTIGATGAIMLWGWRQEKARFAARGLQSVLLMIGLQVIFDLTTPQVSFLGHFSGAILGFLSGSVLVRIGRGRD